MCNTNCYNAFLNLKCVSKNIIAFYPLPRATFLKYDFSEKIACFPAPILYTQLLDCSAIYAYH